MNKSDQINELTAALSAALGEIENASKNANNPHFKSKYADLANITSTIRDVWPKHGLAYAQGCGSGYNDKGKFIVAVTTLVSHKSGQWLESTLTLPCSKEDAQGVGSAITYGRRYALAAVAGIAQEDDDGNAASSTTQSQVDAAVRKLATAKSAEELDNLYFDLAPAVRNHKAVVEQGRATRALLQGD